MVDVEKTKRIGSIEAIDREIRSLLWDIRQASEESGKCYKEPFDHLPNELVLIERKMSDIRQLYVELQHLRSLS